MPDYRFHRSSGAGAAALITFYTALFGWKFQQWGTNTYWPIETGPSTQAGINDGLVPTVGWLAYVKDPGGNIFGLMQPDPNAR